MARLTVIRLISELFASRKRYLSNNCTAPKQPFQPRRKIKPPLDKVRQYNTKRLLPKAARLDEIIKLPPDMCMADNPNWLS